MAVRPITILPDPLLRQISRPVSAVDAGIKALADDMFATMYDAPGIGLAAIQVGQPLRLVVCDVSAREEDNKPLALVNPEVVWTSEDRGTYEEGCLSIPDYFEEVERPSRCRIAYLDLDGERREIEADGLLATCLQHEIDHLNGVLFIDYLSRLKRERVVKKFQKAARQAEKTA